MGALRVIFVHGISASVITGDYSASLRRLIFRNLVELGVIPADTARQDVSKIITFHQVNYSDVGHDAEARVLEAYTEQRDMQYGFIQSLRRIAGLDVLRREILTAFSDVLVYKSEYWSQEIRNLVLQQIDPFIHSDDPVTLIGHSLGSVVAFDTLYFNARDNPAWNDAGFRPANLFTMGSPIAIFSLDVDRDAALQTSKYTVPEGQSFPLLRPGGVWYNFLDLQDVIAYPLEVLFEGKFAVEDLIVQTGTNPRKAHTGYWDNDEVARAIAQRLKKDYARTNGLNEDAEEEVVQKQR
jgi:hypothetical protein